MLATLSAADFSATPDSHCRLLSAPGIVIDALIVSCREAPAARRPRAPSASRMPFTVVLRAPLDTNSGDGVYTVLLPGRDPLEGVFLSRIIYPDSDPACYFQAVFN